VVASAEQGHLLPLVEDLRRLDHDAQLAFFARGDQPPKIRRDGVERCFYFQDGDRPAGWTVEKTQIEGLAVVEIGEIPLTHRRLGEIAFAYGTGRVGDQNLMGSRERQQAYDSPGAVLGVLRRKRGRGPPAISSPRRVVGRGCRYGCSQVAGRSGAWRSAPRHTRRSQC
jgi:hypothetical protein